MTQQREIFAVGRGQYENIGDIILRRPLLDWAREAGRLNVYVGDSPDGYDEGLGLQPEDRVYRSFRQWYTALVKAAAEGNAHSIYKPGEIQMTLIGMKEHIAMLPAVSLVRLRGGKVARVGVGSRNFAPLPRAIMWPSNALSSYTRWRDDRTAAYLGFGGAMPDLGFSDGMSDAELAASVEPNAPERDLLVISLRYDIEVAPRPYPDAAWFDGMKDAAARLGLKLCVVTQVSVDDERSRFLAADLGGVEVIEWDESSDHAKQEERLREVYRRTAVAASDRLHVIIAAFTEGAAPVGLQLDDADKISRHFSTIGIDGVAVNTMGRSREEIADRVVEIASHRADQIEQLLIARKRLAAVRSELHEVLGARVAEPVGVS